MESQYQLERVTEAAEEGHNPSQSNWRESQRGRWSHRSAEENHRGRWSHRSAEESQRRGKWSHKISWRVSQRLVESQNSWIERQLTHRAAEESQRRGRWIHNISWRESQRQLKSHNPSQSNWRESQRGKWSHGPAEESHREAGGATDRLKRVTERQVESLNSWRVSQREADGPSKSAEESHRERQLESQ